MMDDDEEAGSDDGFMVNAFQEDSESSEMSDSECKKRKYQDDESQPCSVKKQRSSSDQEYYEARAEQLEQWAKKSISLMLNLRLQLYKVFEQGDEKVEQRAWKKIASMLFPLNVTGEDCLHVFNSLMEKYLASYDPNYGAVASSEEEEEQFRFIEKLLRKSSQIRQQYLSDGGHADGAIDPLSSAGYTSVNEDFHESLATDNSLLAESYLQLVEIREKQKERDRVFEEIIDDIISMQEQKHAMERAFLRKFVYSEFNTRDEQLGMLAQTLMCLSCSNSVPIGVLKQVRRETNELADRWFSTSVSMCAYSELLDKLFDVSDEEDSLWLRLLPDASHFFLPPSALANHVILNEFGFKGLLRMERTTVEKVIEVYGPSAPAKVGKFKPISIERVVLLSLWYLVHDETFDQLSIRFSIREADVSRAVYVFISVIADASDLIEWPESPSDIKKTVLGFENMRDASFPGVLGALGTKTFCTQSSDLICEKGILAGVNLSEYDVCVQAVADSNSVFRHVDTKWIVSEEDERVTKPRKTLGGGLERISRADKMFFASPLADKLARRYGKSSGKTNLAVLPDNLHVLGDKTYPLLTSLMVPFDSDELQPRELLYNKHWERSWSVVGKAFGKVVNRFQRLSCLDYFSMRVCSGIVKAIFAIHNICMKEGDDFSTKKVALNDLPMWVPETASEPEAILKRQNIMKGFVHEKINYAFRGKLQVRSVRMN